VVNVIILDYFSKKQIDENEYTRVPVQGDYLDVNINGTWCIYQAMKVLLCANDTKVKVIAAKKDFE
jgi:hypothetical protein